MLELWFRQFVDGARRAGRRRAEPLTRRVGLKGHGICAASLESSPPTGSTRTMRRARAADARRHRASRPGRAGLHCDGQAALGHRRLSIVDLAAGQQPLSNEDGTRLGRLQRRDLQPRRRSGRSSRRTAIATARAPTPRPSSTPTSSGATTASTASAACSRSRSGTRRSGGCCSCAIAWASSRSTGRCAGDTLLFGSEIKAILASGLVDAEANEARAARVLEHALPLGRRDAVPGIHKLLPGTLLVFEDGDGHDPRSTGTCRPGAATSAAATAVRREDVVGGSASCSRNRSACG